MTPSEFSAILSRLGLTQSQAAAVLGLSLRAIENYKASGQNARAIPEPMAKLLRLMDRGKISLEQVRRA